MIALVTGASSGIGRDIARALARRGIDVIITARRYDRLKELKKELTARHGVKVKIITADLADTKQCIKLHEAVKKYDIDILINNAGFGVFGEFTETSLERELNMLDVNVKAFHTLFKLFLQDFKRRDYGYILNTASSAGFCPGPMFSSYYASKAYEVRMTQAVREELRSQRSHVSVSMLCPGPVDTEFLDKAKVTFSMPPTSSRYIAEIAVEQMFEGVLTIVPEPLAKIGIYLGKAVPDCVLAFGAGLFQKRRERL